LSRLRALAVCLTLTGPAAAEGEPVEVTVHEDPLDRSSRQEPTAASTRLRRADLQSPGADLSDVLVRVPGAQVQRSGGASELSTASLRGATSAQIPVYLAGVRLNDDVTGTADLSRVPLFMLDRVEVFRGTSPEGADRMGLGGAVLLEPRFPKRSTLGAGLGLGSFGARSGFLAGASASGDAGSLVAVQHARADDDYEYVDDAGTVATSADDRVVRRLNADSASWDAWAVGRTSLGGAARVTTVLNGFRRTQGVTGLGVIPARRARATVERTLAAVRTAAPCDLGQECRLELGTHALSARHRLDDPLRELATATPWVASQGTRLGQSAHASFYPTDALRLRFGGSQELELLAIDSSSGSALRARRDVSRADAGARVTLTRALGVALVGALERHATTGPGDAAPVWSPAGRVGLELSVLPDLALLANVGRYARVPTLGELHGQSAVVLGNPELAPETGLSADLGVRGAFAGDSVALFTDAFVFARWADELVAYRRSSLGVVRPYNVESARLLGLEVAAAAQAFDHARLDLALTLTDPRDTSDGRQVENDLLPFQARLVGHGRLELFARHLGALTRAGLDASAYYRASRVADPAGLVVLGEQWSLGLGASARFFGERLALRAAVENALDARQVDTVGMPLPGRSAHGSAEVWW
jgi:iron complex outermembrane receptor protein